MLIRFFLFARNFVRREFYQPFDQPSSSAPFPVYIYILSYHSFMQARFQEIYPQGEILTETSRLETIPRLCSTMPQEPRQPPRSAIKAKVTVYLPRKKISSLDETNAYDRLVKKWNRCELHSWITEIATLVTWDSSKFFFFFFLVSKSVGIEKSYFYFYVSNDTIFRFTRVCVYTRVL